MSCPIGDFGVRSFGGKIKAALNLVTPSLLRRYVGEQMARRWNAKYEGRPVEEIFSSIYRERRWDVKSRDDFSSGSGSRGSNLVFPYLNSAEKFLRSLPGPPSVVDLGCGDFNVGEKLRPYCGAYAACDIVPALIERNKEKYAAAEVNFSCLDIIEDDLPDGDVVFLRQVLQHLSNAQIAKIVPKLYCYKFLVLTEHLPTHPGFPANLDKATGAGIRLPQGSGVVLTEPPFRLRVKSESVLCAVNESLGAHPGIITTTLYELEVSSPVLRGDAHKT